jgi:choline dehydrogenase-like flavoprotein
MQRLFNFKGYMWPDPLDKAPGLIKFVLLILVNGLLSLALLYGVTRYKIVSFNGFSVFGHYYPALATMCLEVIINCLVFSPLIIIFRKCSSLIPYLIVFLPYFLLDLFIEAHYRGAGQDSSRALWNYYDGSIISVIKPPVLKFFVTLSFDAIVFGIFGLFMARLLAIIIYNNKPYPENPTREQYTSLFNEKWSGEAVLKPKRDIFFYLFRILGFGYLIYLVILVLGLLGPGAWPKKSVAPLICMTYLNPALAINTYFKIILMIILAFTSAYNKSLRFYACIALLTGHAVSTSYSLVFHFVKSLQASDPTSFLLVSAGLDGSLIIFFVWAAIKFNRDADPFSPEKDFPLNFSTPLTLLEWLYKFLFAGFFLLVVGIVMIRILTDGYSGIGAVYGSPDPMIGNTVTLYSTLAVICYLLIKRERLRQHFFNALTVPLIFGAITATIWIIMGGLLHKGVWIHIRHDKNTVVQVDWYFVLYAVLNMGIVAALVFFRRLYYKVDYSVNTISPSAAVDAIALTNAFFKGDDKQHAAVLQSLDQYSGGIRGRKRGLLNLPFGLFENVLNFIYGMRPAFSAMETGEQRYLLSRYFLRDENERRRAFIPPLAEIAFQIGLSLNSIISFANYSYINVRDKMGYVPPDARDRLQGDFAAYRPPHRTIAELPRDENDKNNFKPVCENPGLLVAPRVTTPVKEADITDDVDFLVIGSGAGGATAAYRLACAKGIDASKILVVESGARYQPLQDFQDSEIEMMKKIYKEGGLQQTKKYSMTVLQGECLGGSTVVNNAVCFKMPAEIKTNWQNEFGLDLTDLEAEYGDIAREINITALGKKGINTIVEAKFNAAVNSYNLSVPANERLSLDDNILVNHLETTGDGNWNLGNKRMRKRSMLETYIPWAESRAVRFVSNMTAVRFVCSGNKRIADQVILRSGNGSLRKIRVNKAIIVAAGAIASSHFLMRSEIQNKNVGKRLSCNFAFPVAFDFNEEIKAYDGDQITLAALDPQSRSAFETYFNPPAAFSLSSVPFFFNRRDSWMDRYKYLLNFGSLIGSEPRAVVLEKASVFSGQAFNWSLGKRDIANIRYAMKTLLLLGKAAGSTRAIIPTKPGIELALSDPEIAAFSNQFNAFPLRMTDIYLGTAHPQGGNMIAGINSTHREDRVVTEDFKLDGFDNVFVADASLFPTSITINPQWTIMAMSSMAAKNVIHEFI